MTDWSGRQSALRHHKHFQTDIIDPVTSDPASSGGGVRRLGPFHVTYQTPQIKTGATPGAILSAAVIPAGASVIRSWHVPTVNWEAATRVSSFQIGVQADSQSGTFVYGTSILYSLPVEVPAIEVGSDTGYVIEEDATLGVGSQSVVTVTEVSHLLAGVGSVGALTAGEGDIYALIAEPA